MSTPTTLTDAGDTWTGTAGNDVVDALGGNDKINTLAGNDRVAPGEGNDQVDFGDGVDTIVLQGTRARYDIQWQPDSNQWKIKDLNKPSESEGIDFSTGLERIVFTQETDSAKRYFYAGAGGPGTYQNSAPTVVNDTSTIAEGKANIDGDVRTNDSDADGDELQVELQSPTPARCQARAIMAR